MFKVFHKFFGMFLNKPSVHYVKPKALNVFFKNSVNPSYKLINLEKYDMVSINTKKLINDIREKDDSFALVLELFHNEQKSELEVAVFDNRQDLKDAILVLKNKLYSPEKVILKAIITSLLVIFTISFAIALLKNIFVPTPDLAAMNAQQMSYLQQQAQQGNIPPFILPPNVANNPAAAHDALVRARQQADQIIAQGTSNPNELANALTGGNAQAPMMPNIPMPQNQTPAPIEIPQDPVISNFMNGL